jgi:hypothetical protein
VKSYTRELLDSIVEEFANSGMKREDLEARAIFHILNYCLPPEVNIPLLEKPAGLK